MQQQTVPTSRGERNKGVARRFLARGWVPVQFGASGFRRVARRLLVRGLVRCTIRCLRIPKGGTAIPPPEAGFSQSRRASPEAHRSRPNLPVSRCRFPFAFCRTTAPPALQPIPEACLEYHYSKAFLLLSPASGSGWRVPRHTCWANTASPGAYQQHRWGYTPR